jgi:S1-C subfamily serine protease
VIQTDAPATHGNSGGPAIGPDGRVVGVVASLSADAGDVVQGFNFLIPAQAVTKFLAETDVRAGENRFNALWAAGRASLAAERYGRALEQFQGADALMPGQPDVKRAIAEADAKVKNPPPRPLPWGWIAVGVAVVAGGGYGGLAYRRWQRNRFRIKAKDVAKMLEDGVGPVLLDVRKPSAITQSALRIPGATYVDPDALEKGSAAVTADRSRTVVAYCT